jgi:hypothetical protein
VRETMTKHTPKQTVSLGDRSVEVESVEDVDLDQESISVGGRRLTEADAEELADRIRGVRGRPSIDTTAERGSHSPRVAFRVSEQTRNDVAEIAKLDGVRESEIFRQALEEYIRRRRSA